MNERPWRAKVSCSSGWTNGQWEEEAGTVVGATAKKGQTLNTPAAWPPAHTLPRLNVEIPVSLPSP